jgi:hypothetical protein
VNKLGFGRSTSNFAGSTLDLKARTGLSEAITSNFEGIHLELARRALDFNGSILGLNGRTLDVNE